MADNDSNPATRIHSIISRLPNRTGGVTWQIWFELFELDPNRALPHFIVSEYLCAVGKEILAIQRLLPVRVMERVSTQSALTQLEGFFSPATLDHDWSHTRSRFTADVPIQLELWGDLFAERGHTEAYLSAELRKQIYEATLPLRELAVDDTISSSLKALIRRMLAEIDQAAFLYSASGIRAYKDAAAQIAGDLMMAEPELRDEIGKTGVWTKTKIWFDRIGEAVKFADNVQKASGYLIAFVEALKKLDESSLK